LTYRGLPNVRVTAAKEGYYIAGAEAQPGRQLRLTLRPHPSGDDNEYVWLDPRPDPADRHRCANCHETIYREWAASTHATSATNPRFLDVYGGTDAAGNENIGWNLLAEYPDGAGVCAPCHAPALPADIRAMSDLRLVAGVDRLGSHCDFCHKVADVSSKRWGLDHGRFAMRMVRPAPGEPQVFFGPLDDVDAGEDAYLPLYQDSRYCASCHEGLLFGTHAYSTYTEWLASPQGRAGISCQACHMQPSGRLTNIAPGHGGIRRNPKTLASHAFPGTQPDYLRAYIQLDADVRREGDALLVETTVQTRDVGHRTPTGHPSRELLLWVEALGGDGRPLTQRAGPVLPPLAGQGGIAAGGLAGQPGWLYAKVFEDLEGRQPVPYWRVTRLAYDSRLQPDQPDRRTFRFAAAPGASVRVRLLFRKFSKPIADEKGWADNEIPIAERRWPEPPEEPLSR
jgi:hypothetical protein